MDDFLDTTWEYIAAIFIFTGETFFALLQPLHFLGPIALISILAVVTVFFTKLLNRIIITKRFIELEKNYYHWFNLRQEAMNLKDKEKGRDLAKNIDNAELNKAYYDYFFEGLLLGIARKVLPIFFVFAFINEFYQQSNLSTLFGRNYVVRFVNLSGEPVFIGAVFWYFISLVASYFLWGLTVRFLKSYRTIPKTD